MARRTGGSSPATASTRARPHSHSTPGRTSRLLHETLVLVVALEKVERSSGTLIGSSIATIQKSAAPEMLLALMDEAYTGSAIEEPSGNSGSDDSGPLDLADPMFLDHLKDENDGIAAKHWISPTVPTSPS
ncbi:uncharacterized protein [Miscanthus floridulus]|uniref:uncharacterized protein n=1 Tax=Miscanthus floridulus TaxID=154761 RepID=UPI00345A5C36